MLVEGSGGDVYGRGGRECAVLMDWVDGLWDSGGELGRGSSSWWEYDGASDEGLVMVPTIGEVGDLLTGTLPSKP